MEFEFVDWVRSRAPRSDKLLLGIGDDAAVLEVASQRCVVTSDMLMDGVDFVLDDTDPRRVGRKALAVNLSDLAAMAARPVAAIVSFAAPSDAPLDMLRNLYAGIFQLTEEYKISLAGGDTNTWQHPLAISVTAFGEPSQRGFVTRNGASPGDVILVTGSFGGSLLGRHLDFQPRVAEALALQERYRLNAMIDVSDGLSLDLFRVAEASGCGALVDLNMVPIADDARRLSKQRDDGQTPLDHALGDGEDFELIIAVSPEVACQLLVDQPLGIAIARIGEFIGERGLWQAMPDGTRQPLTVCGYEHQ